MIKRRELEINDISYTVDPRFGNFTVYKITYTNDIGILKNDIFFVANELGNILDIRKIRNSLASLPDQCKLLLKNEDLEKFRCLYYGPLQIDKVNNRGITIINLSGMQRLIFKSRKQIAIEYQNWVFDSVLPKIWRSGGFYDPVEADMNIRKLFSTVLYNHIEINNNIKGMDPKEYERYRFIVNNEYEVLTEDKLLQLRIYDMAFYLFFNVRLSYLIRDAKAINNYMLVASDYGGPDAVNFVYHFINGVICLIINDGIPIENIEYGIYSINTSSALYKIPDGAKYNKFHISKMPEKVDFDKRQREAWENTTHSINPENVADI